MTDVSFTDYDPLAPAVLADPYPYYAELRHHAPVRHLAGLDLWLVSRYDDVRRVMHDHSRFSSRAMAAAVARPADMGARAPDEAPPVSIIGTDGETHARLRQIVNRGFTPRRMASLEADIRDIASGFLKELTARGDGDLQAGFAVPFPTVVIADLLGVDPDLRDQFRRWSEHMVLAVFDQPDEHQQRDIVRSSEQMTEWLELVIAERGTSPGEDLISVLLRAELEGGALTREELLVFVFTLLIAGSITTAYVIGNGVLALFDHPSLLDVIRTDRTLIPALVEETLRYDAPTQMMFRTATRETAVAGVTIPDGASVAALLGSANRDEKVFKAPDRFDPRRGSIEHLAFGHGVHFCLGAALARLEARIAFDELLNRTTVLEPAGPANRVASLVFRGPTHLPVHLVP